MGIHTGNPHSIPGPEIHSTQTQKESTTVHEYDLNTTLPTISATMNPPLATKPQTIHHNDDIDWPLILFEGLDDVDIEGGIPTWRRRPRRRLSR